VAAATGFVLCFEATAAERATTAAAAAIFLGRNPAAARYEEQALIPYAMAEMIPF
jgi:hypothetical protein